MWWMADAFEMNGDSSHGGTSLAANGRLTADGVALKHILQQLETAGQWS
jgi:hypothetical protein